MTEQTAADQAAADVEREEIEKLLPWYVTGTLDCAERARVESYLARNPHTCAQLDLIRAERASWPCFANEALGSPAAAGALDRLMASLPTARTKPLATPHRRQSVPARRRFLSPRPRRAGVRWAGFAAAAVVLVLAAAITWLPRPSQRYLPNRCRPLSRGWRFGSHRICGRGRGSRNRTAAGGIRCQYRGRPQAGRCA